MVIKKTTYQSFYIFHSDTKDEAIVLCNTLRRLHSDPRDPAPEPHSSQSRKDSKIEKRLCSICVAINILSNVVMIDRGAIIIKAKYIDEGSEHQASFKW